MQRIAIMWKFMLICNSEMDFNLQDNNTTLNISSHI